MYIEVLVQWKIHLQYINSDHNINNTNMYIVV